MTTITGKKVNMTQVFRNDRAIGVTIVRFDAAADISAFKAGDMLRVSGISKGKGFQGVVKRHGFSGGPKTHGQKNRHRAPGSIGNTTPQRVIPGRRMAGHMGNVRVTIKNIKLLEVEPEKKIFLLIGAVPGNRGCELWLRRA